MMTNQKQLAEIAYSDCYFVMDWLMNEYKSRFPEGGDTAVCQWLSSEVMNGMWNKTGEVDETGDPYWVCSCGKNEHVYGNHHPENRRVMCTECGMFNFYML